MPVHKRIALLGFGNVGQALAALLLAKTSDLQNSYDTSWSVVAIHTGHHGTAIDPEGINLRMAIQLAQTRQSLASLSRIAFSGDGVTLIRSLDADVLFENTPVDYQHGQPAVNHLRAALQNNMDVITANKGPVVHAYEDLQQLAAVNQRYFLFESTVMDGAPVFSLWCKSLPGAKLLGLRGILNSTSNLILTRMETGASFDDAVAYAQEIGIAESDSSGDIDGWDAAIKVAALSTVLMQPLKPADISRSGIRSINTEMINTALKKGLRWKLICAVKQSETGLVASVKPQLLPASDPLFNVSGTSSAITFFTDLLGEFTLIETDPSPETTAYGLYADFLRTL